MDWGIIGIVIGLIGLVWAWICLQDLKKTRSEDIRTIRTSINNMLIALGLYWAMIFCALMELYSTISSLSVFHLLIIIPIVVGISCTLKLANLYKRANE